MSTLYGAIWDTVFSKWALFAVVTVTVLSIAAVYVTKKYIMPSIKPTYSENNEFVEKQEHSPVIDVVLYYTTWCPHSKTAMATWLKLKETYDGSLSNGVKVRMDEIDCDQEPDAAESANIEEYPTVIASYKGKNYTLDGEPTETNITALVSNATK